MKEAKKEKKSGFRVTIEDASKTKVVGQEPKKKTEKGGK